MFKKKSIVAMLLSLVLVVSTFMGNSSWSMVADVFAADAAPTNLTIVQDGDDFTITWASNGSTNYDIYRSKSRYGEYTKIDTVGDVTTYTDTEPNAVKYENYYKVAEANTDMLSEPISLEMEMFGDNMYIFSPYDDNEQVYTTVNDIFKIQGAVDANGNATDGGQFSKGRYALAFKPGDYSEMEALHYNISYYMQILGLGELPTDVTIKNLHVPPVLANSNVTCNFWMGIENLTISENTTGSNDVWYAFNWSVSQAAPARRLNVLRTTNLNYMYDGWASGGYVADSNLTGAVGSWTQQQYYLRNNNMGGDLYGINWNLVMQGCTEPAGDNWNQVMNNYPMYTLDSGLGKSNWASGGKYTVLDKTDAVREKPFLYYDTDSNEYKVFAPAMRTNAKGTSWSKYGNGSGTTYDISDFYIAKADTDNAASINKALAEGKNILLTPGIYYAEEPINITRANTIVLGLGLATIIPDNAETGIKIADVDGVTLAGVILDADSYSKNMLVVGPEGCNRDHSSNPTQLQDVFIRVGGVHGGVASTEDALVINSNDVIGDHFWIWRADHGAGVGWYQNKANNGVVVNGDDVTLYGLMVEHFQQFDVLWRGENGKTYFLQNEKAYDPQKQEEWMSHEGTVKGYAAYKVANNVQNHYAVGMGSYDVLINTNGASIYVDNAYEVPNASGVLIENACIVEIANGDGPLVGFNSIINRTGPLIATGSGSGKGYARQACLSYCNGVSECLPDYYLTGGNDNPGGVAQVWTGTQPTYDPVSDIYIDKEDEEQEEPKQTVATGPYADWKNNAITYPAKGQLVAAGNFDIEFTRLYGAVQYDVYVDNALVKTISGTDAEAASFEVDYYSVDVAKHTVKVVATMPQGSKINSNIRTFFVSKKGIGIWQDDADKVEEMNNSWYYTWSTSELTGVSESVEFVPMIWGDYGNSSAEYWWLYNKEYLNYNHLLAFNEPDRDDQSNMTAARVVELWPLLEQASDDGVLVGSPATSSPHTLSENGGWFGEYQNLMYSLDYHDDYTAVHFYFDYPGTYVLDILEEVHEDTGKPIWITEWGVAQWTPVQSFFWTGGPDEGNWQRNTIVSFLYQVLPTIDQMDFVERYAWFPFDGSDTSDYGNGAGGLFFDGENDPLNGQLTAVGKAYAELGNPSGYDPDDLADDEVVDDGDVEDPIVDPTTEATECTYNETVSLGAWQYYIGQSWSYATAMYKGGTTLDDFSLLITGNYGKQDWGIYTMTEEISVTPGVEYTITIKMDSNVTTTETIGFKENVDNVDFGSTTLVKGENVFTGTFVPTTDKVQFTFDMGRLPTDTYTTVTGFELVAGEELPTEEETTVEETTTEEETSEEETTTEEETSEEETSETYEKINVVLNKPATSSSEITAGSNAVDGDEGTRWESQQGSDDEWLVIDLEGAYLIDSFSIMWETAAAAEYEFQVSTNGEDWDTVYTVTDGVSGETREATFDPVQATHIRILGISRTTGYGYSIWEMEVYGVETEIEETTAEETTTVEETTTEEETTEEVALPAPEGLVWAGTEDLPHYFAWAVVEGAASYNVYVNDELVDTVIDGAININASYFEEAGDYTVAVTAVSESGLESEKATYVYTIEEEETTTEEPTTEEPTTEAKTEVVALSAPEELVLYNYRQSGEGYKVVFEDPNNVTPAEGQAYYYEVYVDDGGNKLIGTVNASEEFISVDAIDALGLTVNNNYTVNIRAVLDKGDGTLEVSEYGSYTMTYRVSTTTTINTGLPSIVIQAADNSVDLWTDASKAKADSTIYVNDANGNTIHSDFGTANVRGNSTAGAEKKAYNFKFDSKYDLFGMGKAKKWSLLANAFDKSLLRNKLAMDLGNAIGVPYNSQSTFVDVYVNGRYMGNYLLIESVETGSTRVDIDSENDETYNTDVLLELENNGKNEEGCTYITTSTYNQRFVFGSPESADDITEEFFNQKVTDTLAFLNQVETAIASNDYANYSQVIDVESFINFYIVAEYFKQQDFDFSSTRFFIQDGKLYAGPLWDFDLSSGNVNIGYYGTEDQSPEGYRAKEMQWYTALMNNPTFERMVKERFNEVLPTIKSLYEGDGNTMDTLLAQIDTSATLNYTATADGGAGWPIDTKDQADGYSYANSYSFSSYDEAVEQLRTWMVNRTVFLEEEWAISEDDEDVTLAEQISTSIYNMAKDKDITVYKRINEGAIENINDGSISLTEAVPTYGAIVAGDTGWDGEGNPVYATIDLGNYYNADAIEEIIIQYKDNNANDTVVSRSYIVQYSTDGINFYDVVSETSVDSLDAVERWTIDDVSAVQGAVRYVRVYYPLVANFGIQISEIAVIDSDQDASSQIITPVVINKPTGLAAEMTADNTISATVTGAADYTYNILIDGVVVKTGVRSGETVVFENLAEGTYAVTAQSCKDGWYSEQTDAVMVDVTSAYKWNGGQIGYTRADFGIDTLTVDGTEYYNYATYPGKSASATQENQAASFAVDGNVDTRWETGSEDPQSITVDLGNVYSVKAIAALWETASSKDFTIEVSTNGIDYEPVAIIENAPAGADRYDLITFAQTVEAQYVRLTGTSRTTGYGHSIFELGIYGPDPYEEVVETPELVITQDAAIEGYQISNVVNGNRVIGSVEPTINGQDVTSWGFVYAITGYRDVTTDVTDNDMYVGSENVYVAAMESTSEGTLESQMGDSETATYFVRTILFEYNNVAELTAQYKVRVYAVLADGSYVYSDVASYNVFDIAKNLYDNKMMNTYAGHEYLYTDILTVVDGAYEEVDYQWNNTILNPGNAESTDDVVVSDDIAIQGYQISDIEGGSRVVGSVEPTINGQNVVSWGFIYAITEVNGTTTPVTNADMYVGATSAYVSVMESTVIDGTINAQMGASNTARYFARTMLFSRGNRAEFTAKYKVRAYAQLADGSYVYSKITSYSVFDIADHLYQNKLMNTFTAHEYLYKNILTVVDGAYEEVDYQWNNTLVKPE